MKGFERIQSQNVSINVTMQDLDHILTFIIITMKEEWK